MNTKLRSKGFTLLEILIALTILTAISISLLSFLSPWMAFKQKLDTDRKLTELRNLFTVVYERNAGRVESNGGTVFTFQGGALSSSTVGAAGQCNDQDTALAPLSSYFGDGLPQGARDGYAAPFCFFISPQLSVQKNGVVLYYHNVAIVSSGRNGEIDSGTALDASTGALTLGGDDVGALINGYAIQEKKFRETEERMARISRLYESYFTARFLANPSRDVMTDYFANTNPSGAWDAAGTIVGTAGSLNPVSSQLNSIGLGPEETMSAWEINNVIRVGNYEECITQASTGQTYCARSSAAGKAPPYTALIAAQLPGPSTNWLIKVATGNY